MSLMQADFLCTNDKLVLFDDSIVAGRKIEMLSETIQRNVQGFSCTLMSLYCFSDVKMPRRNGRLARAGAQGVCSVLLIVFGTVIVLPGVIIIAFQDDVNNNWGM